MLESKEQMRIRVNGSSREVPRGITAAELIESFHLNRKSVVLELNRNVLDQSRFSATQLNEDDTVEIVHFVGGG